MDDVAGVTLYAGKPADRQDECWFGRHLACDR